MDKKEIRKLIKEKRLAMSPGEVKTKSLAIAEKVCNTEEYRTSKLLLVYIGCKNEVDTRYIIEAAWKAGKRVAAPVVEGDRMEFFEFSNFDELVPGAFGILEPVKLLKSPQNQVVNSCEQLMLMPGVAFDMQKNRIGQGGGYYDRYLSEHDIKTMAVAYEFQLVEEIAMEAHDIRPCIVVTEERIF